MQAIVVDEPGPPIVLQIRELPMPTVKPDWVLIRVRAFGLNRSEMYTRQGHSPSVQFPRVLGIECVGEIADPSDSGWQKGHIVTAIMGNMGRAYDGGYAEYTLVPTAHVIPIKTTLPWATLAAIPETFLTAWGSLVAALQVQNGQTLLIRGGTSALGMAATSLAKDMGLTVLATTRNPNKKEALLANGVDHVLIDNGKIAPKVRAIYAQGVDRVLELVGTVTLLDSLQATAPQGVVCQSGILGNAWVLPDFQPLAQIPSTVKLTVYSSETLTAATATNALQMIVDGVENGRFQANIDHVFQFSEIVAAHEYMESNQAKGKLVVVV